MITESIQLKGCVDAKYANFFLSLLEKHEHSSLLTDEIVQDFCIGGYDYPDEFSVTGIPAGWIDSQNKNEVFHQLKDIETTLSHYLRKTWHNDAIYPMDIDTNFSSVFNDSIESMLFLGTDTSRPKIEIEMSLNSWNLLKRICRTHQSNWEKTLN